METGNSCLTSSGNQIVVKNEGPLRACRAKLVLAI